jgi:hypothetical protein
MDHRPISWARVCTDGQGGLASHQVRIKSHSSHDVVLLCARCHARADFENDKLRKQLVNEVGTPIASTKEAKESVDNVLKQVVAAASALVRNRERLPTERREELLDVLRKHFGRQEISDLDIESAGIPHNIDCMYVVSLTPIVFEIVQIKFRKVTPEGSPADAHGAMVVRQLCSTAEDLATFTRRWRQWFLDSMKPQHLSKHWDVDHSKPNDDMKSNYESKDEEDTGARPPRPIGSTTTATTTSGATIAAANGAVITQVSIGGIPIVTASSSSSGINGVAPSPSPSPTSSQSSSLSRRDNGDEDEDDEDNDSNDAQPSSPLSKSAAASSNNNNDEDDEDFGDEIAPASTEAALPDDEDEDN